MGRKKNDAVLVSEETPNSSQFNSKNKKKKKNKNKGKHQNETSSPERNIHELDLQQNDTESTKKKKNNKHHKSNDNVDDETKVDNVNGDETVTERVVVVTGKNAEDSKYDEVETFAESGLPEKVLECCKGFEKPSPIQSRAWPFLLDGRDLIGIAATGSGKTLAFGIPAIMHVMKKGENKAAKGRNPLCLMLSPTRELAQQISDVMCDAGRSCVVESVCLHGATSKGPQISSLKSGVDIVIGTPGRLQELIEMGVLSLKEASFVVLDEADRMLDMGFEQVVRSILGQTSSVRQMVMFSATWPLAVHHLAQEFMDPNPVKVVVGSEDLAANHDVMQIVEVLDERARDKRLVALLEKYHKSQRNRVLVFVLYKLEASRVENMLQKRGWKAVSIHGGKAQHARTKALSLFKEGICPLMVATDVAARGLDIPDVEVVINYSFPLTTEDYVHRIGRTGRAGKKGVAHTFFTQLNKGHAGELVNVLREAGQIVPEALMKFGTHVKKKETQLGRSVDPGDLFLVTHRRNTGQWVDTRSQHTYESYQCRPKKVASQAESTPGSQPVDVAQKIQIWRDVFGGVTRGRCYGTTDLSGNGHHQAPTLTQELVAPSHQRSRSDNSADGRAAKAEAEAARAREEAALANQRFEELNRQYADMTQTMQQLLSRISSLEHSGPSASAPSRSPHSDYDDDFNPLADDNSFFGLGL